MHYCKTKNTTSFYTAFQPVASKPISSLPLKKAPIRFTASASRDAKYI